VGKTSHHLLELNANLSKTIGERAKLLLITRKSHMRFRLTPRLTILELL